MHYISGSVLTPLCTFSWPKDIRGVIVGVEPTEGGPSSSLTSVMASSFDILNEEKGVIAGEAAMEGTSLHCLNDECGVQLGVEASDGGPLLSPSTISKEI